VRCSAARRRRSRLAPLLRPGAWSELRRGPRGRPRQSPVACQHKWHLSSPFSVMPRSMPTSRSLLCMQGSRYVACKQYLVGSQWTVYPGARGEPKRYLLGERVGRKRPFKLPVRSVRSLARRRAGPAAEDRLQNFHVKHRALPLPPPAFYLLTQGVTEGYSGGTRGQETPGEHFKEVRCALARKTALDEQLEAAILPGPAVPQPDPRPRAPRDVRRRIRCAPSALRSRGIR
jgi:hypothetical protein